MEEHDKRRRSSGDKAEEHDNRHDKRHQSVADRVADHDTRRRDKSSNRDRDREAPSSSHHRSRKSSSSKPSKTTDAPLFSSTNTAPAKKSSSSSHYTYRSVFSNKSNNSSYSPSSVSSRSSLRSRSAVASGIKLTTLLMCMAGIFGILELRRAGKLPTAESQGGQPKNRRAASVVRQNRARGRLDVKSLQILEAAESFSSVLLGTKTVAEAAASAEETSKSVSFLRMAGRRQASVVDPIVAEAAALDAAAADKKCTDDPSSHPMWTFVDLFLILTDLPDQAPLVPFLLKSIDAHLPCYRNLVVLARPGDESIEGLFAPRHRALFEYVNPLGTISLRDWGEYAILTADRYVYAPYVMLLHPNEAFCASADDDVLGRYLEPKGGRVVVAYDDDDVASDSTLTKKFRRGTDAALKSDRPLAYNFVDAREGYGPVVYPRWLFAEVRSRLVEKHGAPNLTEFWTKTFDEEIKRADLHRLGARSVLGGYAFLKYHERGDERGAPGSSTRDSRAKNFVFVHKKHGREEGSTSGKRQVYRKWTTNLLPLEEELEDQKESSSEKEGTTRPAAFPSAESSTAASSTTTTKPVSTGSWDFFDHAMKAIKNGCPAPPSLTSEEAASLSSKTEAAAKDTTNQSEAMQDALKYVESLNKL